MSFIIKVEPEAQEDIQKEISWYNDQEPGSGNKFHLAVLKNIGQLKANPFYQIRYDNVRCLPFKKYPYMIHFTIHEQEKIVVIHGIFNTSRDPKIWKDRI